MLRNSSKERRGTRRLNAEGVSVSRAIVRTVPEHVGSQSLLSSWRELKAAQFGMPARLLDLLNEKDVTDVLINGSDVWVDRGNGLTGVDLNLGHPDETRSLAVRMAAAANRRLDDASPVVDAVLGESFRLHAVLPPISGRGVSISLRVIRRNPFSLSSLVKMNTMDPGTAAFLKEAVRSKQSLLICGGTGVGKTTLLASLLAEVPGAERIVCIEEISELAIRHPHVVHLQARPANVEGEGEVGLQDLVRAAVRMRPDRLVLGECRGAEVREVLTALNTGHAGGCATIHSNSIEDVPARLYALGALGGLSPRAITSMAASSFDVLVFLERQRGGRRRVSALGKLKESGGRLSAEATFRIGEQ